MAMKPMLLIKVSLFQTLSSLNFIRPNSIFLRKLNSKSSGEPPLKGIRVLDLTRIIAGPYCTMILGDLGAEILKIEKPGSGDEARKWGPPFFENTKESVYFSSVNRNKKSVCIDLKKGKDLIYKLAQKCDILVENYVPDKLSNLGLGYDQIKNIAPHLIYCSLSGYGSTGPYKNRLGYDVIAASLGGLMHITGPKDGPPCKPGVALTDIATGLYAHGAIMAALIQRMKTQKGQWIQCNLLSTQLACLINIGANYLNSNREASRWGSAHESIVPYESFKTKNGYLTVGAGSNEQFAALVKIMDLPDLEKNDKFKTNSDRVANRQEIILILQKRFEEKTNEEWNAKFENASFPYGQVNNMNQEVPTVCLKLRKPRSDKKVQWTQGTVDNENMNKKKSKCCCIYEKPKKFGESSSEDSDDECEHCHGSKDAHKKSLPSKTDPSGEPISPHPEPISTGGSA